MCIRDRGFTALHLAPRGAFRRMEHSARPAPVRLHERRLFQDGAKFRGKIGIFPQDTGGLPAAGVHQQGIGVAVRFGTAPQQFSVVIAGRVIARPDVYKRQGSCPLLPSLSRAVMDGRTRSGLPGAGFSS